MFYWKINNKPTSVQLVSSNHHEKLATRIVDGYKIKVFIASGYWELSGKVNLSSQMSF